MEEQYYLKEDWREEMDQNPEIYVAQWSEFKIRWTLIHLLHSTS